MSVTGILVLAFKVPENNQDDFPISRSVTACLGKSSSEHRQFPSSRISDIGLMRSTWYLVHLVICRKPCMLGYRMSKANFNITHTFQGRNMRIRNVRNRDIGELRQKHRTALGRAANTEFLSFILPHACILHSQRGGGGNGLH